ncbi:MAG: hypothetical protein PVH50_03115 [Anaerolineae bacterium]
MLSHLGGALTRHAESFVRREDGHSGGIITKCRPSDTIVDAIGPAGATELRVGAVGGGAACVRDRANYSP